MLVSCHLSPGSHIRPRGQACIRWQCRQSPWPQIPPRRLRPGPQDTARGVPCQVACKVPPIHRLLLGGGRPEGRGMNLSPGHVRGARRGALAPDPGTQGPGGGGSSSLFSLPPGRLLQGDHAGTACAGFAWIRSAPAHPPPGMVSPGPRHKCPIQHPATTTTTISQKCHTFDSMWN